MFIKKQEYENMKASIQHLVHEKKAIEEELWLFTEMMKEKSVGIMTVEVPLNLTKDKIDEILGMIQKRMDDETEKLGLDLDWIIMPSVVKNVQIITIDVKKKEEQK